jgi:hypothetical protein
LHQKLSAAFFSERGRGWWVQFSKPSGLLFISPQKHSTVQIHASIGWTSYQLQNETIFSLLPQVHYLSLSEKWSDNLRLYSNNAEPLLSASMQR